MELPQIATTILLTFQFQITILSIYTPSAFLLGHHLSCWFTYIYIYIPGKAYEHLFFLVRRPYLDRIYCMDILINE